MRTSYQFNLLSGSKKFQSADSSPQCPLSLMPHFTQKISFIGFPKSILKLLPFNKEKKILVLTKLYRLFTVELFRPFTMIMVLLRMRYMEFPKLCGHRNSSSWRISREQYPSTIRNLTFQEETILKHFSI